MGEKSSTPTKRQVSKRLVSKRPVFKFDIVEVFKDIFLTILLQTEHKLN